MEIFGFELAETARLLRREFDRRAGALGVTRAQWRVLARLSRAGEPMRQVDLADQLDVEPITLCRMIDRLAEAELVERRRDEHDRRAWRLHLTARAEPVIADLKRLADAFYADALAGIAPEDRAAVLAVLERIRNNLKGSGEDAAEVA